MAGRRKFFELLDFPKFAEPSVLSIDPLPTAAALLERLGGKSFMSYGKIWPRVIDIVRGLATDTYILSQFNSYGAAWKNESLHTVVRLLRDHFGGKGTWYPERSSPKFILGFWFKPSIRGIWFHKEQAYAVVINARKGQSLSPEDVRFMTRGVYELYCRDDPNNPIPLILDLSEREKGKGRQFNVHQMPLAAAAPLEEFELALRQFLDALNLAGIAQPLAPTLDVISLFKK